MRRGPKTSKVVISLHFVPLGLDCIEAIESLETKPVLDYSYFNLRCRIKASSLQDKTEGESGILMNNYQQN